VLHRRLPRIGLRACSRGSPHAFPVARRSFVRRCFCVRFFCFRFCLCDVGKKFRRNSARREWT
jgi:hypothetical protein